MSKFLDSNGLLFLWSKITARLSGKVDKVEGKQLSANDYTTEEKMKLAGLSSQTYCEMAGATAAVAGTSGLVPAPAAGMQGSFLRGDGIWAEPESVTHPAVTASSAGLMIAADKVKLDGFQNAGAYALKTEIAGAFMYKGSKAVLDALPAAGNEIGDVWNVEADGMNYAWDGAAWDALGAAFAIDTITNEEIDAILASDEVTI